MRMTKGSTRTPAASAKPGCLIMGSALKMNSAKTETMMVAAATTTEPARAKPVTLEGPPDRLPDRLRRPGSPRPTTEPQQPGSAVELTHPKPPEKHKIGRYQTRGSSLLHVMTVELRQMLDNGRRFAVRCPLSAGQIVTGIVASVERIQGFPHRYTAWIHGATRAICDSVGRRASVRPLHRDGSRTGSNVRLRFAR